MKYYIIAGEASGDLHAANLIHSLKKIDKYAQIRGMGGDKMLAEGADIWNHYKNTAYMGYKAVIMNIRQILKIMEQCKQDVLQWNPDVVILVDYPGFNLKIAKFGFNAGFKVYYYIAPKIWAWKGYRIKSIKKYVHKLYSILPFEVEFYEKHNYPITYVGNPVLDNIERTLNKEEPFNDFIKKHNLSGKPIISLLPGSRKQEIKSLLPTMCAIAEKYPTHEFVISGAPGIEKEYYKQFAKRTKHAVVFNDTYQLLLHSEAALIASGTATLETALIGTPQVVCYKVGGGIFAYAIGKFVFRKIGFISLVNLIMGKLCVTELLQQQFNKKRLHKELKKIVAGGTNRQKMLLQYKQLLDVMGKAGASDRAAQNIVDSLTEKQ